MKLSYWLAFIGSIIMIGSEMILGGINAFLFLIFTMGATGPGEYGLELMPLTISISLVLGILALIYTLKSKKGGKKAFLIILIIGIIAAVGVFIPITPARIIDIGGGDPYPDPAVNLVNSLLYIEPFFLINYGLIGRFSFLEPEILSAETYADVDSDDYSLVSEKDL